MSVFVSDPGVLKLDHEFTDANELVIYRSQSDYHATDEWLLSRDFLDLDKCR